LTIILLAKAFQFGEAEPGDPRGVSGGVASKAVDRSAVEEYLRGVDIPQAIAGIRDGARKQGGRRGEYLAGLEHF